MRDEAVALTTPLGASRRVRGVAAVTFALVATAFAPPLQNTPKNDAPPSLLDELIEKSKQITGFRASFTMTNSDEPEPTKIQCDYQAPSAVRVAVTKDGGTVTNWCVDRVLVIRTNDKNDARSSRVDLRDFDERIATVNAALKRDFGETAEDAWTRAMLTMKWSIDATTQDGEFTITAGVATLERASSLGWLETLRDKRVAPTVDGELLRFTTDDGHVDVAISKSDGFLRDLVAHGKKGTMVLHLDSVAFDSAEAAEKIVLPSNVAEGDDHSLPLRATFEHEEILALRDRTYHVVTLAAAAAPWDDSLRKRIESVLQPIDDWTLHVTYDPWSAQMRTWIGRVADRLRRIEGNGAPAIHVAAVRDQSKKTLDESLAQAKLAVAQIALPKRTTPSEVASKVLDVERDVAAREFDVLVRDPLLAEFAKATGAAQK
jgi:hypothetical protein